MANASWKLCSMSGLQTPSASADAKSFSSCRIKTKKIKIKISGICGRTDEKFNEIVDGQWMKETSDVTFTTFDLMADHQASLIGRPHNGLHISSLPAFNSDLIVFQDGGVWGRRPKQKFISLMNVKHSATSGFDSN